MSRKAPLFRFVHHTSEVKIFFQARHEKALFVLAARALTALAVEDERLPQGRPGVCRARIQTGSKEDLLVAWMNEVIYWLFTKRFIPRHLSLGVNDEFHRIDVTARGRFYKILPMRLEIKSATYHGIHWRRRAGKVSVSVIVDV